MPDTTDVSMTIMSISSRMMIRHIYYYVDDMLIVAKNKAHIQKLKAQLKKKFDMTDLREAKKILGIKITRDRGSDRLWLSQENYILKVLKRFNMTKV